MNSLRIAVLVGLLPLSCPAAAAQTGSGNQQGKQTGKSKANSEVQLDTNTKGKNARKPRAPVRPPSGPDREHVEDGSNENAGGARKPAYILRDDGVVEITFGADATRAERIVPPDEIKMLRANKLIPKILGDRYFSAKATIRPRRLAPGESGTLHVIATLLGDTVVSRDAITSLEIFDKNVPATLGPWRVVPADSGDYVDTVEFRMPITIREGTPPDKFVVPGHVELEIHDGKTGALIGVFFCGFSDYITVGPSLGSPPQPPHIGRQSTGDDRDARADPTTGERDQNDPEVVPGNASAPAHLESGPDADEEPSPEDAATALAPAFSSSLLVLGALGLGALVLGLLVWILVQRSGPGRA